MQANELSVLGN